MSNNINRLPSVDSTDTEDMLGSSDRSSRSSNTGSQTGRQSMVDMSLQRWRESTAASASAGSASARAAETKTSSEEEEEVGNTGSNAHRRASMSSLLPRPDEVAADAGAQVQANIIRPKQTSTTESEASPAVSFDPSSVPSATDLMALQQRRLSMNSAVTWSTLSSEGNLSSTSSGEGSESSPFGLHRRTNIWTKIADRAKADKDPWADPEADPEDDPWYDAADPTASTSTDHTTFREAMGLLYDQRRESLRRIVRTLRSSPHIVLTSLAIFTLLTTTGLLAVRQMSASYQSDMLDKAHDVGVETAQWFKDEFDKLLMPMFTVSQFVKMTDTFRALPQELEMAAKESDEEVRAQNIREVCTDPTYLLPYKDIVDGIRNDANLGGILFNVRLSPGATTCLIDRATNTEDYADEGWTYDSTGAIGHNWIGSGHPMMEAIIRQTILDDVVTIAGPMAFDENSKPTMDLTRDDLRIKEFFCAHLAINMPGYEMRIDDEVRPTYGYVQVFFDWAKLKEQSGIYDRFDEHGVLFKLTRSDKMYDAEADAYSHKEVTIAQSPNGGATLLADDSTEIVPVETSNGEWIMHVGYAPESLRPSWYAGLTAAVVVMSFLFSVIVAIVMVEKVRNRDLLYKMMPPSAIKKLHRGQTVVERFHNVTIFFSDIVGFTTMAGEMTPIEVMRMLNELYLGFDKLVETHGVYKVETIGDAYMVIGGAPDRCTAAEAAEKVALFALDALEFVKTYRTHRGEQIFIRAGLASGSVVAGVVGDKMPRYCFFGDTVNFASRMESTSKRGRIQCSDLTKHLLRDAPNHHFMCEERREGNQVGVEVKGKGMTHTWWVRKRKERKPGDKPNWRTSEDKVFQNPYDLVQVE